MNDLSDLSFGVARICAHTILSIVLLSFASISFVSIVLLLQLLLMPPQPPP